MGSGSHKAKKLMKQTGGGLIVLRKGLDSTSKDREEKNEKALGTPSTVLGVTKKTLYWGRA